MLEVFIQLDDSSIVVLFFTRDELRLWTLIEFDSSLHNLNKYRHPFYTIALIYFDSHIQ